MKEINDDCYINITKNFQYKLCCINMYGGKEFVNRGKNKAKFQITRENFQRIKQFW